MAKQYVGSQRDQYHQKRKDKLSGKVRSRAIILALLAAGALTSEGFLLTNNSYLRNLVSLKDKMKLYYSLEDSKLAEREMDSEITKSSLPIGKENVEEFRQMSQEEQMDFLDARIKDKRTKQNILFPTFVAGLGGMFIARRKTKEASEELKKAVCEHYVDDRCSEALQPDYETAQLLLNDIDDPYYDEQTACENVKNLYFDDEVDSPEREKKFLNSLFEKKLNLPYKEYFKWFKEEFVDEAIAFYDEYGTAIAQKYIDDKDYYTWGAVKGEYDNYNRLLSTIKEYYNGDGSIESLDEFFTSKSMEFGRADCINYYKELLDVDELIEEDRKEETIDCLNGYYGGLQEDYFNALSWWVPMLI